MPELPEVETIARALRDGRDGLSLVGRTISHAEVWWDKTVAQPSVPEFKKRIVGQTVQAVTRRAKYLVISLSEDTLLIHLRMSGDLLVGEGEAPLDKYTRVAVYFEDGGQLAFSNPRKFGRVWLVADPQSVLGDLGPEPLDEGLTDEDFHQRLTRRKRQLKPLLLDQHFIAGVGNIYADEALNLAQLHPRTVANMIDTVQAAALLSAIRQVLEEGIRRNGASIDWIYRGGEFQYHFRVYDQAGEPCPKCATPVEKIVVGQRGTHFCPRCQPNPVGG